MSASHAEFVSSLLTKLNTAFRSARMHGDAAHDHQKLYHDDGLRHQPYDVGAMVWLSGEPHEAGTPLEGTL